MSNQEPTFASQPDEPVIGGPQTPAPTPPPQDDRPVIGGAPPEGAAPESPFARPATPPPPAPPEPEPEYDDGLDDGSGYGYEDDQQGEYPPIYVQPYEGPPQRSPMFFVLLFAGVVVMGAFLFLLYSLLQGDDGTNGDGELPVDAQVGVIIDIPTQDQRINVGTDTQVLVRAQSNEAVIRFVLFLNGQQVAEAGGVAGELEGEYGAAMTILLDETGSYELKVRAETESGATAESRAVAIVAIEPVDEQPEFLVGTIVARVNLRSGPDESFPTVGTLDPDDEVHVTGRSRNGDWLFIDLLDGVWVKRTAVRLTDSPSFLPVVEPTPTPGVGRPSRARHRSRLQHRPTRRTSSRRTPWWP